MSATATKEKRVKIDTLRPPAEIRSNTKARRAWLAAELEKVKATPERDGKIVGVGSYQEVSVYSVTQVEGRLRHRGICQFCGNSQVTNTDRLDFGIPTYVDGVKNPTFDAEAAGGALVLHGYKRPGDGATYGKCPGAGSAPLNTSKRLTEQFSKLADDRLVKAQQRLVDAVAAEKAAMDARYKGVHGEHEAYQCRPQAPRIRTKPKFYTDADKQLLATYEAAVKVWRQNFPLTAALESAKEEHSYASQGEWQAGMEAEHFRALLASGTFGSKLEEEVVP